MSNENASPARPETSLTVSVATVHHGQRTVRDSSTSVGMTEGLAGPTQRLFDSLVVYHDIASRSATLNMAIDEALLENAIEPTIRFYKWDHPALSFRYLGKFDEVTNHSSE